MKKLVFPLIILIVGFAAGYFYANSKTTATGPAAAGKMAITDFHSDNSISYDEAKLLVDTFGTKGLDDANGKPGGKGAKTRSIFIPLTKLDALVAALDAARAKDGKTDGIRIYFGRYPKMQLDRKPYDHPYRNTIIIVSTKDTSILQRGGKIPVNMHLDYFGAPDHSKATFMLMINPDNRGEMCPNNCDGATLICPDPSDPDCQ
ncbi:hypothetical protein [Mucilaginibacter sp. UYCu711]|uniref:hypothetical protein n=1 Tax=Mucilaginibacter sp. UYCu711 TaxID=3156339 RepID=UPI003D25C515